MSSKSLVNYNINSNLLHLFEKKKGNFKKSNLVEFWINCFVEGKKGFIPTQKDLNHYHTDKVRIT